MHLEAKNFTLFIKNILPEYFNNKVVLDVGGGDINGNNSFLFNNCVLNINDVCSAPNVTIVSRTKDLPFSSNYFDTIISTECFEHDCEYDKSLLKIYEMLKPNGLFFFTCASTGRKEHGTINSIPNASYGTIIQEKDMMNYYKNLTEKDINEILDINKLFMYYDFYYNSYSSDLYFIGIKNGNKNLKLNIPIYYYPYVDLVMSSRNTINMTTIFNKHNTDKNSFFHNYTRQYQTLLESKKENPIYLLEIGVDKGNSLRAWREYFINSKIILGLDINSETKKQENIENNIFVEILNATTNTTKEIIENKYGYFDIIIDDGSHNINDVIDSFNNLFYLLKDGGIYIIEDTVCYKSNDYIINSKYNADHLNYFTNLIIYLNQWRYDSEIGIKDNCVDPFKILKKSFNIFEIGIDKIEFGSSYIAIYKKIKYHWL